jgi:hypothetical protein
MCTQVRLDVGSGTDDNNTSTAKYVGALMYPGTGTKVYAPYMQHNTLGGVSSYNRQVYMNWFDWSTLGVGAAVQIQDETTSIGPGICSVYLTASSTWLVGYSANGPRVKESVNLGVTWPVSADVDGVYGTSTRAIVGMITDGTTAWLVDQESAGGGNSGDLFMWKRTGAGTWVAAPIAGGKIHDAAGISTAPVFYGCAPNGPASFSGSRIGAMKDANTGFIVLDFKSTAAGADQVVCLYTTDGWTTVTKVVVKDYTGVNLQRGPSVLVGTDNRVRCMWVDAASGRNLPQFAWSDDWGAHWTFVGSPAILTSAVGSLAWDEIFNRAFYLGATNDIHVATFDSNDGTNLKHRRYVGNDTLTGWTEVDCQNLAFVCSTDSAGDGFVVNGNYFRLFSRTNTHLEVNILFEAGADVSTGGGPPLVVESLSGSDQPNEYLRLDIADKMGWSAHEVQGTCFVQWPEGDYTTQRRKHELLYAAGQLDANIQDPAVLPAYWKIDDQERWGKEAFVVNADGTYTGIDDPLLYRWRSAELTLGETGSSNILRAIYMIYRREGNATFDVQVWLDGEIVDTQTVTDSWPDPSEFWWPIPRAANVGTRVQLRVEDRELADLIVESFAVKFRPKHWRMRG